MFSEWTTVPVSGQETNDDADEHSVHDGLANISLLERSRDVVRGARDDRSDGRSSRSASYDLCRRSNAALSARNAFRDLHDGCHSGYLHANVKRQLDPLENGGNDQFGLSNSMFSRSMLGA